MVACNSRQTCPELLIIAVAAATVLLVSQLNYSAIAVINWTVNVTLKPLTDIQLKM